MLTCPNCGWEGSIGDLINKDAMPGTRDRYIEVDACPNCEYVFDDYELEENLGFDDDWDEGEVL